MERSNELSEKQTEILIRSWISCLLERYKDSPKYMERYFRYEHLGKKLWVKISKMKSAEVKLLFPEDPTHICISIGKCAEKYTAEIKKGNLCLREVS